ncbi:MAG: PD-(D/E)XK nuclease family protein, partial [Alphaproteobacteria bacterium]|nr:PD-(D/E)XK nuclease family protein [Alphaproteobacteria bacterium]
MGKIYNIDITDNFLKTVSDFIKRNIEQTNIIEYIVILPNHRSCRDLKNYLLNQQISGFPKIVAISDLILFNNDKVTTLISGILRKHNKNIPINTIFELAINITNFIKELIINNIDYSKLHNLVPNHLLEYWTVTISIINECVKHPEINKIIQSAILNQQKFIQSINNKKIIAAGIGNTNSFTKQLLRLIFESKDGLIFTLGVKDSQNNSYNKEMIGSLPFTEIKCNTKIQKRELAEFQDISEEAEAISIAVREAIHEHKKTLIVVPNVDLASKIKTSLRKWNIIPDDSYGENFSKTYSGMLILQIIDAILNKLSTVLYVFKMLPQFNKIIQNFELYQKQQTYINSSFFQSLQEFHNSNLEKSDELLLEITNSFYNKLNNNSFFNNNTQQIFSKWTNALIELTAIINPKSAHELTILTDKYINQYDILGYMTFEEYANFFKKHCLQISIRSPQGYTPDVIMLGIIEAQIIDADLVIIANANEDSFISSDTNNFWMSESMMKTLNLPTRETQDKFIQCIFERLAYKPNVLITRSEKISNETQVKYPFLKKIETNIGLQHNTYLSNLINIQKTSVKPSSKIQLASPSPDIQYRPHKFSVTDIELLKNNPYAFYAKKILHLKELNEISEIKNLRGNYIHTVLDLFVKKYNQYDIYKIAEELRRKLKLDDSMFGLWFFRINDILAFVENNTYGNSLSEIWGKCTLSLTNDYNCQIICKADRVDYNNDSTISIIDYKTSSE